MVRLLPYSDWDDINWKRINYRVRKIQKRIAEATLHKDWHKVRELQNLVMHSYDCRLYAVHRVTTRKNIRTPGLDGLFLSTSAERFAAVDALDYRNYYPQPFKRFYVPKDHDKSRKRPLSVPNIFDRAAEALFLIAIDPVVETLADAHAYGFRRKRSAQDAVRDIVENFGLLHGRQWVLKADVKGCFDHLSHDWILQNIVFDKTLMRRILKCGYVYQERKYPLYEGMPQGGVLSPTITTFVLSGFEAVLSAEFAEYNVRMVRFVDDFIFAADSSVVLENVRVRLSAFLAERGLWLAPEKTEIVHVSQGFDFIGWHFQKMGDTLSVGASAWSIDELKGRIEKILIAGRSWTTRRLILRLNDVILGWGLYHKYLCSPEVFADLDEWVQSVLWRWARIRWRAKSAAWIYAHHWTYDSISMRKEFSSTGVSLMRFSDIVVRTNLTHDISKNPYLEYRYFQTREKMHYEFKKIREGQTL